MPSRRMLVSMFLQDQISPPTRAKPVWCGKTSVVMMASCPIRACTFVVSLRASTSESLAWISCSLMKTNERMLTVKPIAACSGRSTHRYEEIAAATDPIANAMHANIPGIASSRQENITAARIHVKQGDIKSKGYMGYSLGCQMNKAFVELSMGRGACHLRVGVLRVYERV